MLTVLSRHVVYPLVELRDPHRRMATLRALERDQWLAGEELQRRQIHSLRRTLEYAGRHCQLYRERFASARFDPSTAVLPDAMADLPILTKDDIRQYTPELMSSEYQPSELIEARTGGSTGVALQVYFDSACQAQRNASAMRSDGWAGWRPGYPVGTLWGNAPVFDTVRPWLRNALYDRATFLDTMNMTPATMSAFFRHSERQRHLVLYGHAHSLYLYAAFLRDQGLVPRAPAGIISTSMMLLQPERQVIEEVFRAPVTNRYGCEEVGLIASECECHDGLHLNTDHVFVEFLDEDGLPVGEGEEGLLAVTDLTNRGMPLIRYMLGDLGVRSSRVCACGRGLPLMERVTGRVADFLIRPDGSRVAGISMIERTLTLVPGVRQMQVIQDSVRTFHLNIVPDGAFSGASEQQLRAEFQETFGPGCTVTIALVSDVPRLPSGKYRFSICNVGNAGWAAPRVGAGQGQ